MLVQTDSRWANVPIGNTTIGKSGCLLVCLCMANEILGNPISPDSLAMQLSQAGGFRNNGDLLWVVLRNTASLAWLCLGSAEPVSGLRIVEYGRPNGGSHFVLEYGTQEFDPNPGTERLGIKSVRCLALIDRRGGF